MVFFVPEFLNRFYKGIGFFILCDGWFLLLWSVGMGGSCCFVFVL